MLLALPWPEVEVALLQVSFCKDAILIDATHGFADGTTAKGIVDFGYGSSTEYVASLAPGARVVKAMNSVFMSNSTAGQPDVRYRRVIFLFGDDNDARAAVADLFEVWIRAY